ncbi:hypothetical protein J2T13_001423 [Paenibacillus sp. DS2015]|uniref:zincin-like metallopeptidase toxin domain-containing protein n=1 Tax=Paenibacillus sp. DS2015 TaxID=3373917 RepID=UPI003D19973C
MTRYTVEGNPTVLTPEVLGAIIDRYNQELNAPSVKWGQVGLGVVQAIGGGLETFFGVTLGIATSETVVGGMLGAYVATHGSSNVTGGFSRIWNGFNGSDAGDTANSEKNMFEGIGGEVGLQFYNGIDLAVAFAQPADLITKMIYKSPTAAIDAYKAGIAVDATRSTVTTTSKTTIEGTGNLDFIDETGRLGGKLYSEKDLNLLGSYLEKRGITMKVGDEFVPFGKGGGFNYNTATLVLRNNPTQYEVWHELSHIIQYRSIGKEAYSTLPRTGRVPMNDLTQFNAPEQFVYDMLANGPNKWNALNEAEQLHASWYIMEFGGYQIMELSREQAEKLALEYVNKDTNGNYELILISVEISKISPQYWAAAFEVRTIEGHLIEGPLLILVDDNLEKAMTLDEAVEIHFANRDN